MKIDSQTGDLKKLQLLYRESIQEIMIGRLRVVMLIGSVLYMSFNYLDRVVYSDQTILFLFIRSAVCVVLLTIYFLSYIPFFKKQVFWLVYIAALSGAGGISLIVYLSNGIDTRYNEGVNLVLLTLILGNSFYVMPNLICGLSIVLTFVLATYQGFTLAKLPDFFSSYFFMSSTLFLVILMTRFYGKQHLKEFLQAQALKATEVRIEESYKELGKLYDKVDFMAKTDELTQLYNRRYLVEALSKMIRQRVASGRPFYLLIFDIDYFKRINDTGGHLLGDYVLTTVAQAVKGNIREGDFIGRYGGDEFVIFLNEMMPERLLERARQIAETVKRQVLKDNEGREFFVTVSIGAAKFNAEKLVEVEALMRCADQALLKVKRTQRGRIALSESVGQEAVILPL